MNRLSFLLQYFFKPRTVGAVLPSSRYLAEKMVSGIDFDNANCIVEYGAGTGVFTDKILRMRSPATLVILFEMNNTFCRDLKEKYGNRPNLHIVNGSAQNVGQYLQKYGVERVDYVVSGLPFASLPQDVSNKILTETKKWLKPSGVFITFQYTLLKMDLLGRFFDKIEIEREFRNVPPAYVLHCR
ncbi:MAG: methyltransferase domain-containing protein [Firmicutes bacterium]|nr:methyltransferase domain-containing protein [Bacillota bacterium]